MSEPTLKIGDRVQVLSTKHTIAHGIAYLEGEVNYVWLAKEVLYCQVTVRGQAYTVAADGLMKIDDRPADLSGNQVGWDNLEGT